MAQPTVAEVDERIASAERDYKKLLADLRADRRAAMARERQADRDFQKQVRDWIGELVLSQCPGGWRSLDPVALERSIADGLAGLGPSDELPLADAQARWRDWRKGDKASSTPLPEAARPAREPDDGDTRPPAGRNDTATKDLEERAVP